MKMTPGDFNFIWKAHIKRQEAENRRTAMICATITNGATLATNVHLKPKDRIKKQYSPDDFLGKPEKQKKQKPKQQTTEQMLATVRMLNAAFGGKDASGK